jgi:hypothetical protein
MGMSLAVGGVHGPQVARDHHAHEDERHDEDCDGPSDELGLGALGGVLFVGGRGRPGVGVGNGVLGLEGLSSRARLTVGHSLPPEWLEVV